jgi:hypothetical protein
MGLTNRKVKYGEQKIQTSTKIFHFIQRNVDLVCFSAASIVGPVFIEANVDKESYWIFLENNFIPFWIVIS